MTHRPLHSRRTLLTGLAAAALAFTAGLISTGTASGAEPVSIDQIAGAAGAGPKPAVRQPIPTTTTTVASTTGKILFPMQVTPTCNVLSNFADSRSGGRAHEGIDILSSLGQEVYTPSAGTLTVQYVVGGTNSSLSGNAWGLEGEDGNYYFFAHLSRFADGLVVGSKVTRGQLIGSVGDTGNPGAGNYHLHFEIHPGGMKKSAVNPLPLLEVPKACNIW
jgi:murein DD-endopeptidase MepM/ murein hydrolase activator NlpD